MTVQYHSTLFKVVTAPKRTRYTDSSSGLTSALVKTYLNGSRARNAGAGIDYKPTLDQNIFLAARNIGTPILLFIDAAQAFDFADKHDGKAVYAADGVGELIAVERVLKLRSGWARHLVAFWAAVKAGEDVSKYTMSRSAPAGTMALFGHVRLLSVATRPTPEVVAPLGDGVVGSVATDGGPDDASDNS